MRWLAWWAACPGTAVAGPAGAPLDGVSADLRPVVVRDEAPARYRAWRAREGMAPAELSCLPAGPRGLLVCFRLWEHGERRWVHRADLVAWGATVEQVRDAVERRAQRVVAGARLVAVDGLPHRYLQIADGDGWAAAGVLLPGALAERLGGGPVRVAVPAQGVLVAYRAAGVDLDRVMAVGVREIYAEQPQAVSPTVHEWTGEAWRTFGEAVPKEPPQAGRAQKAKDPPG